MARKHLYSNISNSDQLTVPDEPRPKRTYPSGLTVSISIQNVYLKPLLFTSDHGEQKISENISSAPTRNVTQCPGLHIELLQIVLCLRSEDPSGVSILHSLEFGFYRTLVRTLGTTYDAGDKKCEHVKGRRRSLVP